MSKNIAYIISSNRKFFPMTYPLLNDSLLASGICKSNILWFVGGYDENKIENNIYICDHNSFDLTSLIGVFDFNISEFSHAFLLHDTCSVGPLFKERVENFDEKQKYISLCGFMTMGMFNLDFFKKTEKKYMLSLKNMSKQQAGDHEVYFYKKYGRKKYDPCKTTTDNAYIKLPNKDVYNTGNERRVCYFDYIDLYKYPRIDGSFYRGVDLI